MCPLLEDSPFLRGVLYTILQHLLPQSVQDHYARKRAEPGFVEQPLTFSEDSVILDVPIEGITTDDGWKITPLASPSVNEL